MADVSGGTAYEEEDGGFSFSRKQSKKTKAQPQPPSPPPTDARPQPEPEVEQQAPVDDAPTGPAAPATRQKKKPRKTLPVSPEPNKLQAKTPQRRSKRLSGDNNPPPPNATQVTSNPGPSDPANDRLSTPEQPVAPLDREESPQLQEVNNGQDLHVEKKRRLTIPLPFADTPIIRRNKEMRKNSAENSRRSSSGMRGRRASSLIDTGASHGAYYTLPCFLSLVALFLRRFPLTVCPCRADSDLNVEVKYAAHPRSTNDHMGEVQEDSVGTDFQRSADLVEILADEYSSQTAVPHSEVETQELYKHISQDLVEPKRMRQLLTWCGTRALPEKPSGGQIDAAETAAMHAGEWQRRHFSSCFGY